MQSLLCVDFSSPIIEVGVVSYDEQNSRIAVEQLLREDDPKLFTHPSAQQPSPSTPTETTSEQAPPAEPPPAPTLEERLKNIISSLKDILSSDTNAASSSPFALWSSVVAIIPSTSTFSVIVPLPIKEPRLIQKVLPLEIEDALPLTVDAFHVESAVTIPQGEKGAEILATIASTSHLNEHLTALRNLGLEPDTFTTLEGILSSMGAYVHDESGNFILMMKDPCNSQHWACALFCEKILRHAEHICGDDLRVYQALKTLSLISEDKYGKPISAMYHLGTPVTVGDITLAKAPLDASLIALESTPKYFATLNALTNDGKHSATEIKKSSNAINFRSGAFAYKLQLKEFIKFLRQLIPAMSFCILAIIAMVLLWCGVRAYTIRNIELRARDEIAAAINDPSLDPSFAHQTLKLKIEEVRARLRDLGSVGKISPLDALLGITKDFPLQNQVEVRSISIKEKKIVIDGSAPEYDAIDKMERALLSKRGTYCRVKSTPTKKGDSGVDFSFEIFLCD